LQTKYPFKNIRLEISRGPIDNLLKEILKKPDKEWGGSKPYLGDLSPNDSPHSGGGG
jgi:hypothetical protein